VGGGESGEKDDREIEKIGEEQTSRGGANGEKGKKLERRHEEGEGDEEPGELALG